MTGAISGLVSVIHFLQVLFVYGVMSLILLMLYRVSKEVGEVKRSLIDLREAIALAQLPRIVDAEKTEPR